MKRIVLFSVLIILGLGFTASINAQCSGSKAKAVKASYTEGDKDVVDIAISSEVHTTLVAAVKAAGLVETLKSEGPFTIFAPTNAAFEKLPKGTVESLLKPENKDMLTAILTYHVVAGDLDSKAVVKAIQANGGKAEVTTIQGQTLVVTMKDGNVYLIDENRNLSKVTAVDLEGTNGVIHVIDTVVLPE